MSIKSIEQKFTSANSVPVERAVVAREEWEAVIKVADEIVNAAQDLVRARNLRLLRGRDHVPSMRAEQDAAYHTNAAIAKYKEAKQ